MKQDEDGEWLEVPRISDCYIVPCTVKISHECTVMGYKGRTDRFVKKYRATAKRLKAEAAAKKAAAAKAADAAKAAATIATNKSDS